MTTINQTEMMKLAFGLYDRGIEFKAKSFFDGIQFIIGDWDWDAICHSGSYGHEDGLIEVMGLAVLPSRLKKEMAMLKDAILTGKDISGIEEISKHTEWVNEFTQKYSSINEENIDDSSCSYDWYR